MMSQQPVVVDAMQRVRNLFTSQHRASHSSSSSSSMQQQPQPTPAAGQDAAPTHSAAAAESTTAIAAAHPPGAGGVKPASSAAAVAAAAAAAPPSSAARSSRNSKSSRGGRDAAAADAIANTTTVNTAAAAASYAASSQPHTHHSSAHASSLGRTTPAGLRSSNASVASSEGGASSSLAAGMHALDFSNSLQTHDEDMNLYLMAEWARSNKRAKQRHAGVPYLLPAHGHTQQHHHQHPSSQHQSSQYSVISSAQSSSEYGYSPPSHSRSLAPSHAASHNSTASQGMPMHAAHMRAHATSHAPPPAIVSPAHSQHSSPSGSSLQRKRVRPVSTDKQAALEARAAALAAAEFSLPAAATAAAVSAVSPSDAPVLSVPLMPTTASDDMLSDSGESEQIEIKFHADNDSPSNAGSPTVSPNMAARQLLSTTEQMEIVAVPAACAADVIPSAVAAAMSTAASAASFVAAPGISAVPPSQTPLDHLQSHYPQALPLVFSFLTLRAKALMMQVRRQWQSIVLTEPKCWEASHWHPMVPLSAVATHASQATAASVASSASSPVGLGGGVRDACGVFARLNQTYGVGAEHARWIVPPVPPHSFLLSRLCLLDLKLPDTLSSGARGASNIWTDAHLVLLPYFSALTSLDLSYMGASDPNNTGEGLNSTGSSTQSAMARPAGRLTGVVLARVALLPCLQRLVLDHCGEWVDDEALACLRNKYNCRLSITPGETPPPSEEYANAVATAAASGSKAFLHPITSLPSLTHLSLEFCARITAHGLAYLVSSAGLPSLRELNLSNCSRAVSALSMQALSDSNNSTLRALDLSWCGGIGKLAASKVSTATLLPLATMGALTRLELRGWGELQAETLEQLCASATGGAGLVASISNFLAPRMPLVSLNLRGCSNLGAKGLAQIGRLSTLVELDLSDCRVVCDATLRVLGYSLHKLERLVMWTCTEVTDRGIEALLCGGQALQACWKLQRALHARAVDALGAEAAASADLPRSIAGGSCLLHSLRSLKLSSASRLTDSICTVLCHCTRLGELELMDLPQLSDAGLRALCATIARHHGIASGALQRTLHTLHLSRGGPGLTSACGASLRALSGLTNLDVSWNERVGDDMLAHMLLPTAFAFAGPVATQAGSSSFAVSPPAAQPRLPNLRKLNLARCAITSRGLQLLVDRATSLSELDVRYCPSLSLAHIESFRCAMPGAAVEHTCSALTDEEEDEDAAAAAAAAAVAAASMHEEEVDLDPPSPLELQLEPAAAAPMHTHAAMAPPVPVAPPSMRISVPAVAPVPAASLPLLIVSPCSLTQSSSSGSSPPRMHALSHVAVPLAAVASHAKARAAFPIHSGSDDARLGDADADADAADAAAGAAGASAASESEGGGFRVECQVVENEDGEDDDDDEEAGEDEDDDDDDDDEDDEDDDSMRSHSQAAALPTFVQEEDEQGDVWAVQK